jgi:hypothetical protein
MTSKSFLILLIISVIVVSAEVIKRRPPVKGMLSASKKGSKLQQFCFVLVHLCRIGYVRLS